ncbi:MAG: hypothetical protein NTU94_14740, partial [Planctomycetota bacterium]|nr:hypothetical protein [Planctomycetota bacterium]
MARILHHGVAFALLFALLAAIAPAALSAEAPAPNLVKNPGFEDGAKPWSLPQGFEVVEGASSHSGGHGLRFARQDVTLYDLASQRIDFRPGARYQFSAWVRTKGVAGPESGATICMEWSGPKGWIGGAYPEGRKGDSGWFQVIGITPPIPKEATGVSVTLYLRKGMTGEAWFDDVQVTEYAARPMEAYLVDPAYRGLIFADESRSPIRVHVDLAETVAGRTWRPSEGYGGAGDLVLVCRLRVADTSVAEKRVAEFPSRSFAVELGAPPLTAGEYQVQMFLEQGGRKIAEYTLDGRILPAGQRPRVSIDRHRRTIIEGKPFFPLGFYLGTIQDTDLEKMAAAGFNCVMPYALSSMPLAKAGELLDVAQRRGIKVIYSVKDLYAGTSIFPKGGIDGITDADAAVRTIVERFRSHPAVLAWYLNDELPATMRHALEARYRLVRR